MIQVIPSDRVRYTLRNRYFQDLIIVEPEGWDTDEKEYQRHKDYGGIFAQFSNSLKFVKNGMDFINMVDDLYGINEDIQLIREERNPESDIWELTYKGFLDLSTKEIEDDKVSIKFNSGGLEQALKSRDSEAVELDRITTMDGDAIPELNPIQIQLDGRNINLISEFIIKPENNSVRMENFTSDGNTRGSTIAVPLFLNSISHENAQSPLQGTLTGDNSWDRTGNGETGNMFFANSDKLRVFRLTFTIVFTVKFQEFDDIDEFRFWCRLGKYKDGVDYNIKENITLFTSNDYSYLDNKQFSVSFDDMVTLEEGESLALVFDQNFDGRSFHNSRLNTDVVNISGSLKINEDSFYDKSITKGVLIYEICDRLTTICTNSKNAFKSDLFGRTDLGYQQDGKWSLVGLSHGFWIRGFDKLPIPTEIPKVDNLFKPLTTSFKENFESINAVFNVGLGIETEGNKEYVRIEEESYFWSRNVLIRLPNQVKNVKRVTNSEYYYSSLEFGYEKGGDYQEAQGLDEYNAKSNFTTVIKRLKNTYSKVSKHRADSYGQEFARRKPISKFATEDTPYDNDVFFNDLKRDVSGVFLQRKWQDDFEKIPTGVFSPETATNLRLSPVNIMLRHGWWFAASFLKYMGDFVRYSSSTQNSRLKTKAIGKPEYSENGNIVNSEFDTPRFVPTTIEFDHKCDYKVMQQVNGYTDVLGKPVRNLYGLIEFTNENNQIERGFLLNLKPNNEGKWQLLKFNGNII